MMVKEKIDSDIKEVSKYIDELKKIRREMKDLYIPTKHGQTLIDIFGSKEDKENLGKDKLRLQELQAEEKAVMAKLESRKELFNVSVMDLVKSLTSYVSKDLNSSSKGANELIVEPSIEKGVLKCKLGTRNIGKSEFVLPTAIINGVKKHATKGVKKHATKGEILANGKVNILESGMLYDNDVLSDDYTKVYLNAIKNTLIKNAEEISKNTKTPSDTVRRLDEMMR